MSDDARKQTVEIPAAANAVLANEKIAALERAVRAQGEKLDLILGKLDAGRDLVLEEARKRETNDEKLGRSLDRIDEKLFLVARVQAEQADTIAETHALARAAVDIAESVNRKLADTQAQGAQSAPHAKPAE